MQGGAGADQEFNAMRLVKNEETQRFWAHHFGPKVRFVLRLAWPPCGFSFSTPSHPALYQTFKVTWDQFRAAFEHEFEAQRDSNIELLRQRLDRYTLDDADVAS
jgi:hypothetical protein